MAYTSVPINIKDAAAATQAMQAYNDGTNSNFPHSLLDNTGAIMGGQLTKAKSLPVTQSGGVLVAGSTITRQANTTAYADGQMISVGTTAAQTAAVAPANGVPVSLVRCRLQSSHVSSIANGIFKVWIFEATPSSMAADAAVFTCTLANCAGYFDVTLDQIGTDFSIGIGYPHIGAAINVTPASNSTNIYWLLSAHAAYTPASSETLQVFFEVL